MEAELTGSSRLILDVQIFSRLLAKQTSQDWICVAALGRERDVGFQD